MSKWKLATLLLICYCGTLCFGIPRHSAEAVNFELIYPERIHVHRSKRDLSTKVKETHDDDVTFRIPAKPQDYIVDLERREPLHSGTVRLLSYDEDGSSQYSDHVPEDCHYHGKIRGKPNSNVYISTCSKGLTGSLDDGEKRFDIEPHGSEGLHKLYQVDHMLEDVISKLAKHEIEETSDSFEDSSIQRQKRSLADAPIPRKYQLIDVEPQYLEYLTTNRTRYVEMFVTADHGMYEHYKDKDVILERILNTLGQVDVSYQAIGIRIVLVALEIQTSPTFERHKTGGADLNSFRTYFHEVIKKSDAFKNIRIDNAQLFSHYYWSDCAGMAYVGTMCSYSSTAVNAWSFSSVSGPVIILGHEFGHNLNFPHDGEDCKCLTPRGCFMGGGKSGRPGFSDCNMKRLALKTFSCMNDHPIAPMLIRCGNAIKDPGEECDCGTPENCLKNGDHCCQPHTCKLKAHVQCSHVYNPGCCSEQCFFRKQGTRCRKSNGNCDVAEYCTGESAECPTDQVVRNGFPCGDSIQLLFGTREGKTLTTTDITPDIVGQYFKFVPKKWTKDGWACMQIEMLGCEPGQAGNVPTSITTKNLYYHGAMCITPNITDCTSVPDGTKLIYKSMPDKNCNHERMLFVHHSDGTLTHKCSGKKVCPGKDGMLVVSSDCEAETSKFTRTKMLSLSQNGKCWNSVDGWPHSGDSILLHTRCDDMDIQRTTLIFQETDCALRKVGLLPDTSFASGSKYPGYEPYRASMLKSGYWCSSTKTEGSWLQINLEKPARIDKIQIKGSPWNGVTGYNLYFSDDGIHWQPFKESGAQAWNETDSMCYNGNCAKTYNHQCQELWNADSKKADDACWNDLNTNAAGYGTCEPVANTSCQAQNVFCGQLQCNAVEETPYYINYGTSYAKLEVKESTCSAAVITNSEQAGLGMVEDGTMCGNKKMCINQQCKTAREHGLKLCIVVDGKECNGKGVCRQNGVCQCERNLNPKDGCLSELPEVNGGWSDWGGWTVCTKGCGGGTKTRFRHCNQPVPKYGGEDCTGSNVGTDNCNEEKCPIGKSCKAIRLILEKEERPLYDGIYTISPKEGTTFKAYCDMTTDGGGWSLLVSSHTNTWTPENVRLRNEEKPSLKTDYSILKHADHIKYNYLIAETTFEYRLEAHSRGEWGGIWKAPSTYLIDSTDQYQEDVTLLKKFGTWEYYKYGINERLPYVYEQRITMSPNPSSNAWGSITDNEIRVYPANWIYGDGMMTEPQSVWYWMREGDYKYPKSCLQVLFRSLQERNPFKSGVYKIEVKGTVIETYCDLDRYGGGWTLVTKASSTNGWTKDSALERNSDDASSGDYSIFKYVDDIKHADSAENSFQYMLEASGENQNGGIFSLPVDFSLHTCPPKGKVPALLKKFGKWDEDTENFLKYPIHYASKNGIFLTASSDDSSDTKGTIVTTGAGSYMTTVEKPSIVKLWVREGGSRKSCNDLKIHGFHKGRTDYKDGFYILQGFQPVYCDMETTTNEGWTLLVSSVTNGWSGDQVLERNANQPSLFKDFSILKIADNIKSLSKNKTFKYMLDSKKRRQWGGIWSAPIKYSFVQKTNKLEDVTLIQKFSEWNYEENWWSNPRKRMPYLGNPEKSKALLTTASYDDYTEWGTIIANTSEGKVPAKWMYPHMQSPGAIWYWLNENDCDPDYSKIDGGYSEWSLWTQCSSFCGTGKQTRHRICNSPIPRCGGDSCDPKSSTSEEQTCTGHCHSSKITTTDSTFCFQPEQGGCNPTDETKIVLRPAAKCEVEESEFIFNPQTGKLVHKCSGKPVCLENGNTGYRTHLVASSTCKDPNPDSRLKRTYYDAIQYGVLCLEPYGGTAKDGALLILWRTCSTPNKRFIFPNIAHGVVKASFYDSMNNASSVDDVIKAPAYPNSPIHTGWLDGLDSLKNVGSYYALRIQAVFIAPQSGDYVFVAACDDQCTVYLSSTASEANKAEILRVTSYTSYHQWDRSSKQNSTALSLTVGTAHYIEGIMLESVGGDHLSIGVYLPDGTAVLPITSQFLKKAT